MFLINSAPAETALLNRVTYRRTPTQATSGSIHPQGVTQTIVFTLPLPEMDTAAEEQKTLRRIEIGDAVCKVANEAALDILLPDRWVFLGAPLSFHTICL